MVGGDAQHFAKEDPKNVPESTRRKVLDRDSEQCQSCGTGGENRLQLHHIEFRSQGGGHDADNLVTLCFRCHRLVHEAVLEIERLEWRMGEWSFFVRVLRRPDPRW